MIVFVSRQAIAEQLHAWMLLPREERISELYFARHHDLPKTFEPGEPQTVAFTIRNLEHRQTDYSYRIAAYNPAEEQVLAEGSATLEHGKAQSISETVRVPRLGDRVAIRVTLDYPSLSPGHDSPRQKTQAIYYWTNSAL